MKIDKKFIKIFILLLIFLWCAYVLVTVWYIDWQEHNLTEKYGNEVESVIENYELQYQSLEVYENPNLLTQILTGPLLNASLDSFSHVNSLDLSSTETWLIVSKADVQARVVEYTPSHFKVVARVVRSVDDVVLADETVMKSYTLYSCNIYVFVKEDNIWKLAGHFPIDDGTGGRGLNYQRDAIAWEKEIIGEYPRRAVREICH